MAVLESCPKHNMVAYLEKIDGNAEFHEIIDFLTRSSIHHALTVSPVDSLPNEAIFNAIQLMGYEGDLTGKYFSGKVTPLFASMLVQPTGDEGAPSERPFEAQTTPSPPHPSEATVSDQAKEIQHLKAHIKKLKKQAKPVGRPANGTISHKDPLFDEIPEDTLDYMETEDAKDMGRTRVNTDREKDSTDRTNEGTDDQTEGGRATQTTQIPTSTIFGDDETIAQVLLNMTNLKQFQEEKEKGVYSYQDCPKDKGKKKIEEEDESESESDGIPEAEKKFKQLASDEEMARKVQEEWEGEEERKRLAEEEATNDALIRNYDDIKARIKADRLLTEKLQKEEREQFTIEERAIFLHDTITAQRKFLAQQRSEAIRNRPPTKNQLRNQMMTYFKHVGNFKHSDLKTKKFEEIQALYEKIKRSDEDFIAIGSAEDERLIKEMNEKGIDSSKNESVKEEDKEEEGTKKRKGGHIKMIARKKKRSQSDVDSDDEHKKYLKIVTFESILIWIMEKKSQLLLQIEQGYHHQMGFILLSTEPMGFQGIQLSHGGRLEDYDGILNSKE
ncbi:hypothetical protein Tco_0707966 [Tanacetum coccineum]